MTRQCLTTYLLSLSYPPVIVMYYLFIEGLWPSQPHRVTSGLYWDVNATDYETSKEITKIAWDEKKKEEFMRATGNEQAQHNYANSSH